MSRTTACVMALSLLVGGCSPLGKVLIPRHGKSMANDDAIDRAWLLDDYQDRSPEWEPGPKAAGAIAAMAIPLVIGAVQKGIETESKRYKATYTARGTGLFVTCQNGELVFPKALRFQRKAKLRATLLQSIAEVLRLRDKATVEPILVVDARIYRYGPGIQLRPEKVYIAGTASKVAWWSLWPWQLPTTLVWAPWYGLDHDIAKVDMNVQITLGAVTRDKNGQGANFTVGTVDFPLKKIDVADLPKTLTRNDPDAKRPLSVLDSPYLPFPKIPNCPAKGNEDPGVPANLSVTIIEANDLGDVLAKGAEKLKDEQSGIADKLKGWVNPD